MYPVFCIDGYANTKRSDCLIRKIPVEKEMISCRLKIRRARMRWTEPLGPMRKAARPDVLRGVAYEASEYTTSPRDPQASWLLIIFSEIREVA